MKKKVFTVITLALLAAIALTACSALNKSTGSTGDNASVAAQTTPGARAGFDPSNMTTDQKLAVGILKLEGSANAITAEQAKALLPLWKAVKSLGSNANTTTEEINGVYDQIKETLTAAQLKAIEDLSLTQSDLTALMDQYGIQSGPAGGGLQNLSESERATAIAQFQAMDSQRANGSSGSSGGQRDFPRDGGGFPGGGPGGNFQPPADGQGFANPDGTTSSAQATPGAGQGFRSRGMSNLFLDTLIKLLTERAG